MRKSSSCWICKDPIGHTRCWWFLQKLWFWPTYNTFTQKVFQKKRNLYSHGSYTSTGRCKCEKSPMLKWQVFHRSCPNGPKGVLRIHKVEKKTFLSSLERSYSSGAIKKNRFFRLCKDSIGHTSFHGCIKSCQCQRLITIKNAKQADYHICKDFQAKNWVRRKTRNKLITTIAQKACSGPPFFFKNLTKKNSCRRLYVWGFPTFTQFVKISSLLRLQKPY